MNELLSSVPLTATSTHCGSGRKGAGKSKVKLAYNDGAPEPMAAGSGSGVDNDGAAVVIQTAARAFLARKEAAARAFLTRRAAARKAAAAEEMYFPDFSVHDVAPPSPEYTLAELLDAAFPDIEDVFSVEELLELWSEFEAGEY